MSTWKNAASYAVDIPSMGIKSLQPGATVTVPEGKVLSPPMVLAEEKKQKKPMAADEGGTP